ncbi:uncharacterized protein LOC117182585 [Belonocnema kinseyi]|uniref:uncharacterized protein LOC117182585 n=1 Tax=Belonocnema kinseyi TaxID=2817044 RepID=UPI00143D4AE1|nr:uncharacterized protein LOC117182585 [Belonocnema kinseyi]
MELKFSVDGLPVSNSGDEDFWCHLCQVHLYPNIYIPFLVSIFSGKAKPASIDVYFTKFVDEINELHENGIDIAGKHFTVQVKCIVRDTPARAFCKNTVGHAGNHACERCTVKGTKKGIGRTVFLLVDSVERSDESFRNQIQAPHRNGRTKLLDIRPNINMIFTFVLDFMHLCCLGIMKKLIEWWLSGDFIVRLGPRMRDLLSERMELLESQVPCEFTENLRH